MMIFSLVALLSVVSYASEAKGFELAQGVHVAAEIQARSFAWSPDGSELAVGETDGIRLLQVPGFSKSRALSLEGWTRPKQREESGWPHPFHEIV